MSDVKVAVRALMKAPGFTAVAVLTMALGIGANSALFSVYDRLILHPVTIPNPSSLVAILTNIQQQGQPVAAISWPRYEEVRSATAFSSVGVSAFDNFTLTGHGDPLQLNGLRVSASFLPTLGILPAEGRNFSDAEDVPNGPPVCIISHELWQSQFGGRESIVGETISLNGQPWQVVGVMPPRLSPPFAQVQVLAPRVFEVTGLTAEQVRAGAGYSQPIARLKTGVTLDQAATELASIARASRERAPTRLDANNPIVAQPFVDSLVAGLQPTFYTLLGAVGFVLLIACANVSSLFLGRLTARRKEIAVRLSLGATRWQIVRQFQIESLLFSVVAGGAGVLVSIWALSAIQSLVGTQLPPNTSLSLDWRALVFTVGVTVASALLVGLVPSLQASRPAVVDVLKDRSRSGAGERSGRVRAGMIVTEVALSVVLLVGSSLLLISFLALQRTSPGFESAGVATAFVGVPVSRYSTPAEQAAFYAGVIDELERNPMVTGAAAAVGLPFSGFNPRSPYSVAGREVLPLPQRPLAGLSVVSVGYFDMLKIGLVEGRTFSTTDREGAPLVCVINEGLARRLFPGESALGKVLLRGRDAEVRSEIVGVVDDVKTLGLNAPAPDIIYFPMRQLGRPLMTVAARTSGDPAALQAAIRSAVAAVDKDQPISFFATLDTSIANSLGVQRIVASVTGAFAALALVLSAVGLYSVLAYIVSQRTGEIGIRMALGARPRSVVGLVMRDGLTFVAVGLGVGLAGAAGVARLIRTLLYQVQPLDPRVYVAVALGFGLVAAAACLLPAWRACRIDPLRALRAD